MQEQKKKKAGHYLSLSQRKRRRATCERDGKGQYSGKGGGRRTIDSNEKEKIRCLTGRSKKEFFPGQRMGELCDAKSQSRREGRAVQEVGIIKREVRRGLEKKGKRRGARTSKTSGGRKQPGRRRTGVKTQKRALGKKNPKKT